MRELKPVESGFVADLDAGYKKAGRNVKGNSASNITKRPVAVFKEKVDDYDDSEICIDDIDLLMDAVEA